jgi:Tfp pilus assembly protein PilV
MKNILLALLFVAVVVLGLITYSQRTVLRREREQVRQLNAKLEESTSKAATFDRQEKCAQQARAEYRSDGWEKRETAGFTDHFNSKLNKCFMEIEDTDVKQGTLITTRTLSDAFEGKVYANYIWSSDKKKKYWEVPPVQCKVTLPSGEKKLCHSSDEFDELIKVYME